MGLPELELQLPWGMAAYLQQRERERERERDLIQRGEADGSP